MFWVHQRLSVPRARAAVVPHPTMPRLAPRTMVLVLLAACAARATPTYPSGYVTGCLDVAKDRVFCDASAPLDARLDDLVSGLTLKEKIGFISPDTTTGVGPCNLMDRGVPRLGIPHSMHLVEANTAAASCCLSPGKCATNFPGPTGVGAAFNTTMWRVKGDVIATEMRAMNNIGHFRCTDQIGSAKIGLIGYGPNVNIMRDPRWGRNSEVPGEDPYLSGQYATHYVRGAQEGFDGDASQKYLKVSMRLKHYTAYGVEAVRQAFDAKLSMHDLWETHLPQYEAGMRTGGGNAGGVMCSYSSVNGVPLAANNYLLDDVLRTAFGRPDAVVGTDCGCLNNMVNRNHYSANSSEAAKDALLGGTDTELGEQFWSLKEAGGDGLLEECADDPDAAVAKHVRARIDESVRRVLRYRFRTGQFDPLDDQPYTKLGLEDISSAAHVDANYNAALQSLVLLKNADGALPLRRADRQNLALVGPQAVAQVGMLSDYHNDEVCYVEGHGSKDYSCVPTIAGHFASELAGTGWNVTTEPGVGMTSMDRSGYGAAVDAARVADVVVFVGGTDVTVETEGRDRAKSGLPGLQAELLADLLAVKAARAGSAAPLKVVVILVHGGAIALGADAIAQADAIVDAFFPSTEGARAVFDGVFGANRWGRLPMTVMPEADVAKLDIQDYSMSKAPGRTYKYYTNTPEWEFGAGLSYTTFKITGCDATSVTVQNTGPVAGDAVVMAFHRPGEDVRAVASARHPVPLKQLIAFERRTLAPKAVATIAYAELADGIRAHLELVNEKGSEKTLYAGTHYVEHFDGVNKCSFAVSVKA